MSVEKHVRRTNEVKPYEVTKEKMDTLKGLAGVATDKFNGLIGKKEEPKMKYNPSRFPSAFDDFAQARDCLSMVEQVYELLNGPYRGIATNEDITLYRSNINDMKDRFLRVQYSRATRKLMGFEVEAEVKVDEAKTDAQPTPGSSGIKPENRRGSITGKKTS